MQRDDVRDLLAEGMAVYGADGDKVGSIVTLAPRHFVVEKGFFFPTDYAIPLAAVDRVDGDGVWLTVTKDDALRQQWDAGSLATEQAMALTAPIASSNDDRVAPPLATSEPPSTDNVEPIRSYSTDNTQDGLPSV